MVEKKDQKKKRHRPNKRWIPYKMLTLEEREQLRRESDRKQLRKQLTEMKVAVSTAQTSVNCFKKVVTPTFTNEDYAHEDYLGEKKSKWDTNASLEDDDFCNVEYKGEELSNFVDPNDLSKDREIVEESLKETIVKQNSQIKKLEKENQILHEDLRDLERLMREFAYKL